MTHSMTHSQKEEGKKALLGVTWNQMAAQKFMGIFSLQNTNKLTGLAFQLPS